MCFLLSIPLPVQAPVDGPMATAEPVGPGPAVSLSSQDAVIDTPAEVCDLVGDASSQQAQPPTPKRRRLTQMKDKGELIPNPPVLAPHVVAAAKSVVSPEGVEGNLSTQRGLKKTLEQEAKDKAEQKKLEAETERVEKSQAAIAKAKAKLEKLEAKAKAIDGRKRAVKRKLDPELASAADDTTQGPPPSPEIPKAQVKRARVKLSPRAKQFAASSGSPNAKMKPDPRATKAASNLKLLRELKLDGLVLPADTFPKKILVCKN